MLVGLNPGHFRKVIKVLQLQDCSTFSDMKQQSYPMLNVFKLWKTHISSNSFALSWKLRHCLHVGKKTPQWQLNNVPLRWTSITPPRLVSLPSRATSWELVKCRQISSTISFIETCYHRRVICSKQVLHWYSIQMKFAFDLHILVLVDVFHNR